MQPEYSHSEESLERVAMRPNQLKSSDPDRE